MGRKRSILFIIILLSVGYFLSGASISYGGIAFLFLVYLVRGLATPIFKNYINEYTGSEVRATMLSVRRLGNRSFKPEQSLSAGRCHLFICQLIGSYSLATNALETNRNNPTLTFNFNTTLPVKQTSHKQATAHPNGNLFVLKRYC